MAYASTSSSPYLPISLHLPISPLNLPMYHLDDVRVLLLVAVLEEDEGVQPHLVRGTLGVRGTIGVRDMGRVGVRVG